MSTQSVPSVDADIVSDHFDSIHVRVLRSTCTHERWIVYMYKIDTHESIFMISCIDVMYVCVCIYIEMEMSVYVYGRDRDREMNRERNGGIVHIHASSGRLRRMATRPRASSTMT